MIHLFPWNLKPLNNLVLTLVQCDQIRKMARLLTRYHAEAESNAIKHDVRIIRRRDVYAMRLRRCIRLLVATALLMVYFCSRASISLISSASSNRVSGMRINSSNVGAACLQHVHYVRWLYRR